MYDNITFLLLLIYDKSIILKYNNLLISIDGI